MSARIEVTPSNSMPFEEELAACDEDIQAMFKGRNYLFGDPSRMQLIKEIRALRESISALHTELQRANGYDV